MTFTEKVVAGAGWGVVGVSLLITHYRFQSRYSIIRRLTVGYSTIPQREAEVCESNF